MSRKLIYCILLSFLLFGSCTKKENININDNKYSVLEYIANDTSLSLLNKAIHLVRLDTVMVLEPYTFFAPDNNAFRVAGLTEDSMANMNPQQLLHLLEYHVINGKISSASLPGSVKQQFTSLHQTYQPFITKNYYGIFINGIAVTDGNHNLSDGIVHVIGKVASSPVGNQLDVLSTQKDLTFFTALVRNSYLLSLLLNNNNPYSLYAGCLNNNLVTVASQVMSYCPNGIFGNTVLAPTDSAFKAYGYTDTASVIKDTAYFTRSYSYTGTDGTTHYHYPLVQAYLFNGFDFSCDFKGNYEIPTPYSYASDGTYVYNILSVSFRSTVKSTGSLYTSMDGMSFTGRGINVVNPVKIVSSDLVAVNGVIHKVNQVFVSE